MADPRRARLSVLLVGTVLAVVGGAVTVLYLFQPWRTCPYDSSPAACHMLPGDAAVMAAAAVVALAGAVLAGYALLVMPFRAGRRLRA